MKQKTLVTFVVLTLLVVGASAAVDTASTQGEVLEIQRGVSVSDQGELDRLTIRNRNGETEHLLLGQSGSCPDCVMVGDRVRARVMSGDMTGNGRRVRSMKVRRTGETIPFRSESGELIRERAHRADGTGAGSANGHGCRRQNGTHQSGTRRGQGGSGYHGHR